MLITSIFVVCAAWFLIGCILPLKIFIDYLKEDKTRKITGLDIFVITFSGCCGPFGFFRKFKNNSGHKGN